MERSWLKRDKQKLSGKLYAVKNLSEGLLLVGKGHLSQGMWATNVTEWELTKRGFANNPETDGWLCVTMSEYHKMMQDDYMDDTPSVDESSVDEPSVNEPSVNDLSADDSSTDESSSMDKPSMDKPSMDEPSVDELSSMDESAEEEPKPKKRRRKRAKEE